MILSKLLGEILADMGFVTKQHIGEALRLQRKICRGKVLPERLERVRLISKARMATDTTPMLGQILIDMDFATEEQLEQAMKRQEKTIEVYKLLKSEELGIAIEEGSLINSSLNIAEVLERIMKHVNQVTNSVASSLMLIDDKTGELVFSFPTGPKSDKLMNVHIPAGKGIAGWVAENGQHVLAPDARKDPRFYAKIDEVNGFETKSLLCVPLKAKSKLIGVLEVINKTDGTCFTEEDAMLLNIFANQAAIAIDNARFYGELKNRCEEEIKIQKKLAESEKLRALGLMASGMAHDFNNMLAIILGNVELIEVEEDKEMLLKRLQIIKKVAVDSAHTIKRIQKYTKTKKEDLLFKPIRINDLVRESIALTTPMWKDSPQEKGISIEIVEHLAEEELIILGNASDLGEMIVNLIFNSVDAMPRGGKIDITTYMKDENIYLKISDNGIGMTEETKDRVFDPFFTTKGLNYSGLGLSMSYGILRRHNGLIEIETRPGKGTSFTIILPKGKGVIEKRDKNVIPVVEIEKINILVIDDEPKIGALLSDILSRQGHQTDVFSSAKDGIEAFKKGGYDMLITDLGMPNMSGWEVVRVVRQINPRVLTGMVTGWDISDDETKQKGVDFIINKPFQVNQIVQAVTNAVKSKDN